MSTRRIIEPFVSIDKLRPNLLRSALQIRYPQSFFARKNSPPDCFSACKPFLSPILSEVDTTKKHDMAFCHDVFFDVSTI